MWHKALLTNDMNCTLQWAWCKSSALMEGVEGERRRYRVCVVSTWRPWSRTCLAQHPGVNIHPGTRRPHTHTRNLSLLVFLSFSHNQTKTQAVPPTHPSASISISITQRSHPNSLSNLTLQMISAHIYVYFCKRLMNLNVLAFQIPEAAKLWLEHEHAGVELRCV